MNRITISSIKRQLGVTMIEALVSLFVFSVGALGIVALQTTSIVRGDDTKQRSIAIWKAQELVDKIRSTKTIADPNGQIAEYVALISNDNSDNGIGVLNAADEFSCPNAAPRRCDDQAAGAVNTCNVAQMRTFELWSVMCDPNSGLAVDNPAVGSVGLRNLEVSLEADGTDFRLYFEWLNRTANNNLDEEGADAGLQNQDGSARNVVTNLCGDDKNIDSRLDAYCVRFQ